MSYIPFYTENLRATTPVGNNLQQQRRRPMGWGETSLNRAIIEANLICYL